jgi:hypothetical protein
MKTVADLIEQLKQVPPETPLARYEDADKFKLISSLYVRHMELYRTDREDLLDYYYNCDSSLKCAVIELS